LYTNDEASVPTCFTFLLYKMDTLVKDPNNENCGEKFSTSIYNETMLGIIYIKAFINKIIYNTQDSPDSPVFDYKK